MPSFRRPLLVTTLATLLLAVHWALAVSASARFCTTYDEIAHVTGGYSYWIFDDYRLQPENGNLPQRVAALPLLAQRPRFPDLKTADWRQSNVWTLGRYFFYGEGNPVDYLLLCSHAVMALFSVATGLLVFCWSKRLWGPAGGLFSLTLYAFSPNFLAHGPLATSDVAMVFFFLASAGAWWRHADRLTWRGWGLSAFAFGLACVTKFSAVLLPPMFVLMAAIRAVDGNPLSVGRHALASPLAKLGALAASAFAQGLVAWIIIWAFYGFRYSAFNPALPAAASFYLSWAEISGDVGLFPLIAFCRHWHLLPEAFLYGFDLVLHFSHARGAFLNGAYSTTGWWYFFPCAFLLKTPVPTLLAFVLSTVGIAFFWRFRAKTWAETASRFRTALGKGCPLLVLFGVYWGFSITSHLNIGARHILPVYPPLFILAGWLVRRGWQRRGMLLATTLGLWLAIATVTAWPAYLAYFNPLAGAPDHAHEHLVDSSLDWGQDLPALATWLKKNRQPDESVFLSYFGMGDFAYYGIRAKPLASPAALGEPSVISPLQPGLYCIGATKLEDVYSIWRGPWTRDKESRYKMLKRRFLDPSDSMSSPGLRDYDDLRFARLCLYLRVRKPDAVLHHALFIYRLRPDEFRAVTSDNLSDLVHQIETATR